MYIVHLVVEQEGGSGQRAPDPPLSQMFCVDSVSGRESTVW